MPAGKTITDNDLAQAYLLGVLQGRMDVRIWHEAKRLGVLVRFTPSLTYSSLLPPPRPKRGALQLAVLL
jgi:hypothetical protein